MEEAAYQKLLKEYGAFEQRVRVLMSERCVEHCRVCPTPCCRAAICREAHESPFLKEVQLSAGATEVFDEKRGWLGGCGCRLPVGRPPLCYDFICDRIFCAQPTLAHRYVLDVLAALVGHLGNGVWKGRHLVEALSKAQLRQSNESHFKKCLAEAEAALAVAERFLRDSQTLTTGDMPVLNRIKPIPEYLLDEASGPTSYA